MTWNLQHTDVCKVTLSWQFVVKIHQKQKKFHLILILILILNRGIFFLGRLLKEVFRKDIFLVMKSYWMSCPYLNLSRTYQFTLRKKSQQDC